MPCEFTSLLVAVTKKTGPIPVTTTSERHALPPVPSTIRDAMPSQVRLRYTGARSAMVSVVQTGRGYAPFVRSLPERQLWRHNQAGDLPHTSGMINSLLGQLVKANSGRRGFTYTHHVLNGTMSGVLVSPINLASRSTYPLNLRMMLSLLSIRDCQRSAWCLVIMLIVLSMMILSL